MQEFEVLIDNLEEVIPIALCRVNSKVSWAKWNKYGGLEVNWA